MKAAKNDNSSGAHILIGLVSGDAERAPTCLTRSAQSCLDNSPRQRTLHGLTAAVDHQGRVRPQQRLNLDD